MLGTALWPQNEPSSLIAVIPVESGVCSVVWDPREITFSHLPICHCLPLKEPTQSYSLKSPGCLRNVLWKWKESKDEWGPSAAPSRQGQRQRQGLELWSLAALQSPPRQVPCMGIIQKEAFAPAHSCSRSYSDTLRKRPEQLGCLTSFCKIVSIWFQWLCLWVCDKFITVPVLFCSPQKTRGWEMFQERNPVPQEEKGGTRLTGDDRQRNPRDPRIGCGYLATSEQETQLLLASKHPVTTWSSSLLYLLLKLAFIPNQNPEPGLFWLFSLLSFLPPPFF